VVHPAYVRIEDGTLARFHDRERSFRDGTEAVESGLAIHLDRHAPEELRELAGGATPQQVHLEEAILCVHEPERACHVGTRLSGEGGDAELVAVDRDPRLQPRHGRRALDLRQAAGGQ